MKRLLTWNLTLALLLALLLLGCSSSDDPTDPGDGGDPTDSGIEFTGVPSANPQGVFTNVTTDVVISARIDLVDRAAITEVRVYEVTAGGDSIQMLGHVFDNGNLDNYDEIDGDGVYTGLLDDLFFSSPQTLRLSLLAIASDTERAEVSEWSASFELTVADPANPAEYSEVISQMNTAETTYEDLVGGGATDSDAKNQVVAWWGTQQGVAEAYLAPDGDTVWAVYDDGLTVGVYLPDDESDVFGGPRRGPVDPPERMDVGAAPLWPADMAQADRAEDPDEVHSNLAVILSPFHSWIETLGGGTVEDPCDDVNDYFTDSECPDFNVTYLTDGAADAAAFANLDLFGGICIVTHGTVLGDGQVVLMTGQHSSLDAQLTWFWDLYGTNPTMVLLGHGGNQHLSVKASFISKYNKNFPNSMVYVCACKGMKNNTLQLAFRNNGAGYVCGYDETVSVSYANGVTDDFWFNVLLFGDNAGEAYDAIPVKTDPNSVHANFVEFGNRNLHFSEGLKNGDFELGNLAAWETAGDGRIITQLGGTGPTGGYMGIISTGLGFTTSSGQISQAFCMPEDAATLDLDYDFFSEEFLEYCGDIYQDFFEVVLTDENSVEHTLFYIAIDEMCGSVSPAGVIFDVGPDPDIPDEGVYHTGWRHLSLDVSAFAGQSVSLRLTSGEVGDSIYDSAITLDNIEITEVVAAP